MAMSFCGRLWRLLAAGFLVVGLAGCSGLQDAPVAPGKSGAAAPGYLIGPGDGLQIFVWRNP